MNPPSFTLDKMACMKVFTKFRRLTAMVSVAFFCCASSSFAATSDVIGEKSFGDWRSVLYQDQNDGQLYCSLEPNETNQIVRVRYYKRDDDAYLEIFNPGWNPTEDRVTFGLRIQRNEGDATTYQFDGKTWGDAYAHDLLDTNAFELVMTLFGGAAKMAVRSRNGQNVVHFSMSGIRDAISDFKDCMKK